MGFKILVNTFTKKPVHLYFAQTFYHLIYISQDTFFYKMNFGQNLYQWFLSNAQSLVLMAIVVIGIYLGFKREFSKLIGFLVVALIAVGLVFNAGGVKDVLLELFNRIIGA